MTLKLSLTFSVETACPPGHLAVYSLRVETFWTESVFPRQFPLWRPPAQWSRTVGLAHSGQLHLFREGSLASPGLTHLAQTGDSLALEAELGAEIHNISDPLLSVFSVLPVPSGAGHRQTKIFLAGENSRVSLATALIPSPDWFVGVDNLDLCEDGQFRHHLAVDLQLFDAGTDNGLTFTAPNWETSPRDPVTRITNLSPSHPAASFYYPDLQSLPTIARYVFAKVQEFGPVEPQGGHGCSQEKTTTTPAPAPAAPTTETENFVTIETFDVTVKHPLDRKKFKYEIVKERPQVVRSNETRADKRTGHLRGGPNV